MFLLSHLTRATAAFVLAAPFALAPPAPLNSDLVAHEWGTFTSVAGPDGDPVSWASLAGAPDLPCFVERFAPGNLKAQIPSLIRMETPVLYFYSPRPVTLSVRVQFRSGLITEWYPHASPADSDSAPPPGFGQIHWNSVHISPAEGSEFPSIQGQSRYFAARNTDSTPLEIDQQREKFIFYRGVGNFSVPLRPRFLPDGTIQLRNAGPGNIPLAILFENRKGKIGYRILTSLKDSEALEPPELTGNLTDLCQTLSASLVEFGLYKKEASAMLATWQDSWFEDGMRVFYLVPRERIDSALPLAITPQPETIARVFVGRVEILSPAVEQEILTAFSAGATATLTRFGRFLDPFLQQLQLHSALPESRVSTHYLERIHEQIAKDFNTVSCIR